MRLFMAGLTTETNTFSPMPTGRASFEEGGIFHGDATRREVEYWTAALHIWREMAEAKGWDVGVARASVLGLSLGGYLEQYLAEAARDRMERLFGANTLCAVQGIDQRMPHALNLDTVPVEYTALLEQVMGPGADWADWGTGKERAL